MGYGKIKFKRKGQTVLDFVLAFIVLGVLIIGITRIWAWFNLNYAHRQTAYQRSRFLAANASKYIVNTSEYDPKNFTYIDTGAQENCTNCTYAHLDLDQDWVFGANPPVNVGKYIEEAGTYLDITAECENQCREKAAPKCVDNESFDYNCACFVKCKCRGVTESTRTEWVEQGDSLKKEATDLRASAKELFNKAMKCDDMWDACFWGRTVDELLYGSEQLKREAVKLDYQARVLSDKAAALEKCCNNVDRGPEPDNIIFDEERKAMEGCISRVSGTCDDLVSPYRTRKKDLEQLRDKVGSGILKLRRLVRDSTDNAAYGACLSKRTYPSGTYITTDSEWDSCISSLRGGDYTAPRPKPDRELPIYPFCTQKCNGDEACVTQCKKITLCMGVDDYSACSKNLGSQQGLLNRYNDLRNLFCRTQRISICESWDADWNCANMQVIQRDCDMPDAIADCPLNCGLSVLAGYLEIVLYRMNLYISSFQSKITALENCCHQITGADGVLRDPTLDEAKDCIRLYFKAR